MTNKPVIMIIEDEKAIRSFLKAKLEAGGYRTIAVAAGKDAISLAASRCPDLFLLDLGLPDIDGMEVLAAIREWSAKPVIVVSACRQEEEIVRALDSGADDYIAKPFSNMVLMARIRTALRKDVMLKTKQPQMRQTFNGGGLTVDYHKRHVLAKGTKVHLTPIEYKILALLARNAGEVVTYSAIRREVWGPYSADNCTLRVNMANLRRKIEHNSADPRYIVTETGIGYRMMENDEMISE
ncbi:MAG: response regulator [Christensenellales bacterium]|jgi:two-component system KDP operon response regulator KdpE